MEKRLFGILALAILVVSGSYLSGQTASTKVPSSSTSISPPRPQMEVEPLEIARGEYAAFGESGGIGPVDAEIFNFHEYWSLFRTTDGSYEVEGTRSFEFPKDFPQAIRFVVRLSRELQLIEAQEDTSLVWIPRSAPVTCVFRPELLQCSTSGKDPRDNPDISLSMDKPYAFSWPLSAFSLAALARRSDYRPGQSTDVQFVEIEQPSPDLPLMPAITNGVLRFIGEEKVMAAGKAWNADKFELQAFMSPLPRKSVLWVAKGGFLLVLQAEGEIGPKVWLELTRFEQASASSVFP